MEIEITTVQARVPITILRLKGNLDSASAGQFMEIAHKSVQSGADNVLLDFSGVPYMSSVGIRSLSAIYDWLHPITSVEEKKLISRKIHDGNYTAPHLKILNMDERVASVLRITGLDSYISMFDDETDALAAF